MTTKENSIKLIIGLGNPGPEYEKTRHNAGFWFIDALHEKYGALSPFSVNSKLNSQIAKITINNIPVLLLKPTTYMNESGNAINLVAKYYKIDPQNILVAHDELDLPVGDIRLKISGGHGGHNGLRSISQFLGTENYNRLRIGIGHPGNKNQVTNYVLKKTSEDDFIAINNAIICAQKHIDDILTGNFDKVMKELHTKK